MVNEDFQKETTCNRTSQMIRSENVPRLPCSTVRLYLQLRSNAPCVKCPEVKSPQVFLLKTSDDEKCVFDGGKSRTLSDNSPPGDKPTDRTRSIVIQLIDGEPTAVLCLAITPSERFSFALRRPITSYYPMTRRALLTGGLLI